MRTLCFRRIFLILQRSTGVTMVLSFYSAITRLWLLNRRGFAASGVRPMPMLMIILDNDISGGAAVFVKTPGAPAIPLLLNTWLFIILGFNRLFRQSPSPRGFRPRNLILKFDDGVVFYRLVPHTSHLFLFLGFSQGGVSVRTIISFITSLVLFKLLPAIGV